MFGGVGRALKKAGKFVAQAAYQPVAGLYNAGVGAMQGDWDQAKMGLGQIGKGALKTGLLAGAGLGLGAIPFGAVGSGIASGAGAVGGALGSAGGTAAGLAGKAGGLGGAIRGIGGWIAKNPQVAADIAGMGLEAYGAGQEGDMYQREMDRDLDQQMWQRERIERQEARQAAMDPIRMELLRKLMDSAQYPGMR